MKELTKSYPKNYCAFYQVCDIRKTAMLTPMMKMLIVVMMRRARMTSGERIVTAAW